jgi:hypothetical protein
LSEEEPLVQSRDQAQKTKISLKLEYLQEYSSAVIADDGICDGEDQAKAQRYNDVY